LVGAAHKLPTYRLKFVQIILRLSSLAIDRLRKIQITQA